MTIGELRLFCDGCGHEFVREERPAMTMERTAGYGVTNIGLPFQKVHLCINCGKIVWKAIENIK